jgi:uncharacterized membrane protein YccC
MREKLKCTADASTPAEADEALRRLAAERLADHLEIGISLAGHCEMLAGKTKGDRLGPVYAAARLMHANAAVAEALANLARIERRRRSIVERIQPPDRKMAELNSHLQQEKISAEQEAKLCRRLDEVVEQSIGARLGDENAEDRVAHLLKSAEENLERLRKEEAGEDVWEDDDTAP